MALPPPPTPDFSDSRLLRPFSLKGRKVLFVLAQIIFGLLMTFLINLIPLTPFEFFLYDLRIRSNPLLPQPKFVSLIKIDRNDVAALRREPSVSDFRRAAEVLFAGGANLIAFDVDLKSLRGTHEEKMGFVNYVKNHFDAYRIEGEVTLVGDESSREKTLSEFDLIPGLPGLKTADQLSFAHDGVTRRIVLNSQGRTLFHLAMAQIYHARFSKKDMQRLSLEKVRGRFTHFDTDQVFIDYSPRGSFPTLSFRELLSGGGGLQQFQDRLVIIGTDLDQSVDEYVSTPLQRGQFQTPRLEMHANMVETLVRNSAPARAPEWLGVLIVVVLASLMIHLVLTMRPVHGLGIVFSIFFIYTFIAFISFWYFKYWLPLAQPTVALFLCYYFFIPYRLIIENRRSWEYYEKNKILQQVEELKNNFISMMSHDLKTPIARIQGMVDMIIQDTNPISLKQREAIDTIRQSGDDLLRFINSILNYARIESEGLKLHVQSRDINPLVEDVVRKYGFMAKLKQIEIKTNFEPLFPVEMDPELIRQVVSNLIENAIKYSGDSTSVEVSTKEQDDFVIVVVEDHGPGVPSDELPHIFDKFFRSKGAKNSAIKGTGLGLYLARYFARLHGGDINVKSEQGMGARFVLTIPMSQSSTRP